MRTDIQQTLAALQEPKGMQEDVVHAMRKSEASGADWSGAFATIKRVWASTWNERAFLACRKAAIDPRRIEMCVLMQRLVEAHYAFVLHSVNPTTSDPSEMYGELVVGQVVPRPRALLCLVRMPSSDPPSCAAVRDCRHASIQASKEERLRLLLLTVRSRCTCVWWL